MICLVGTLATAYLMVGPEMMALREPYFDVFNVSSKLAAIQFVEWCATEL